MGRVGGGDGGGGRVARAWNERDGTAVRCCRNKWAEQQTQ
jgi:hypothetical protein